MEIVVLALFVVSAIGQLVEDPVRGKECKGVLKLRSAPGHVQEYREDTKDINIKAKIAVLEGCGCFRLYQGTKNNGRSFYVNKNGEHRIHLRKIGSLKKVACPRLAMPGWIVGLIVLGLVTAVGCVVSFVCKRKKNSHEALETNEQVL